MPKFSEYLDKLNSLPIVEDKSGLALVEFAFVAPIMLTLGLAGLETAHLAATHMQVSQIAMLRLITPPVLANLSTKQIFARFLPGSI